MPRLPLRGLPAAGRRLLRQNFSPVRIYLPHRRRVMHPDPDVVLIQGFFTSPNALDPLVDQLDAAGRTCSVPRLGGVRGIWQTDRVAAAAGALVTYIRRLPARPRWLIGHSMGGMIARFALQHLSLGGVRGLVTLGTPHLGTPTAWLGLALTPITRAPLDLMPLSRTIRRLNRAPWPDGVRLLSISGGVDMLCPPPFGRLPRRLDLPGRLMHLSEVGHTELIEDPRVWRAMQQTLGLAGRPGGRSP